MASFIGSIPVKIITGQLLPARRETYTIERPGVAVHGVVATAPKWPEVEMETHTYVGAGLGPSVIAAALALIGTDPPASVVDQFARQWPSVDVLAAEPQFIAGKVYQSGLTYAGIVRCRWRLRPLANHLGA